jgi:hypothetical protein
MVCVYRRLEPGDVFSLLNGEIRTFEQLIEESPGAMISTYIVGTDSSGTVMKEFLSLSNTRDAFNIDPSLSEDEAIAEITKIRNTPDEVIPSAEERLAAAQEFQNILTMAELERNEPTAEERIAAALEFQNIMAMAE